MRKRSNRGGKPSPSEKVKGKPPLATVPLDAPPQGDPPPAPPPPPPPPEFDPDNDQ